MARVSLIEIEVANNQTLKFNQNICTRTILRIYGQSARTFDQKYKNIWNPHYN